MAGGAPGPRAISLRGEELPEVDGETLVEVLDRGELLGALSVAMPASDPMNPSKERLIRDLAAQAGLVLRNVRLIQELRSSRQRLVAAQDEERRKLERDLHDGAQQQLVALAVQLKLARTMLERDPATVGGMLDSLQTSAADALADLRDLARGSTRSCWPTGGFRRRSRRRRPSPPSRPPCEATASNATHARWRRPCTSPASRR